MFKALILSIFLFTSCSQKIIKSKQAKNLVTEKDSATKVLRIRAQFVDFYLGDTSHYTFRNEARELIVFDSCKACTFEFEQSLPEEEANDENQGWGSNKKLQGKWFILTYTQKKQPFIDGSIATVKVITKAVLD